MDFHYTPEQEAFRHEVRRWLEANLPPDLCVDDAMDERVPPDRETLDQVLAAVSAVTPAFEIAEMRGDMATDLPLGVADDVAQWGYVTGTLLTPYPVDLDLGAVTAEMRKNGDMVQQVRGREVIDDQLQAIAWLANHLAAYGMALEAGQCIMTGSMTRPAP
ncbi:MAG: hypothetical protein HYZ72_12075 [Deltaproteobacteria bacterium]|nr:hypothetical protein [Deltaproteobacteria bacterium]